MATLLKRIIAIYSLLLLCFSLPVQGAEPCSKVPADWKLESQQTVGVLCADVLIQPGIEGVRKLRVFDSGKPAFESDAAALCQNCGGARGDPFQGIKWNGQILSVDNEGGSRESWVETWKIGKREQGWVIIGWDRHILDHLTMDMWSESVNALTGKATSQYQPGEPSCDVDPARCKNPASLKPRGNSCAIKQKSPPISQLTKLREQHFACGLKMP